MRGAVDRGETPLDRGRRRVGERPPHVGDIVRATARGGGGYRAVWVYRNDELVAACPGGAGCRFVGDATIADVELRSIGNYLIVGLSSSISPARDSRPRLFEITADTPAFANARAKFDPSVPAPMMPILMRFSRVSRRDTDRRLRPLPAQ